MHSAAATAPQSCPVLRLVEDRTHDGHTYRMLNLLDEFTHECLAQEMVLPGSGLDQIKANRPE